MDQIQSWKLLLVNWRLTAEFLKAAWKLETVRKALLAVTYNSILFSYRPDFWQKAHKKSRLIEAQGPKPSLNDALKKGFTSSMSKVYQTFWLTAACQLRWPLHLGDWTAAFKWKQESIIVTCKLGHLLLSNFRQFMNLEHFWIHQTSCSMKPNRLWSINSLTSCCMVPRGLFVFWVTAHQHLQVNISS